MVEVRLPAHAQWIEALVAPEVAEQMGLAEAAGEEGGRVVFATDDPEAVWRVAMMLSRSN